ncbi:MAG: DUF4870 domain-containing protein [Deltaproteobacteria bacterium]|nr:DUF4870 domain-containing protein [Deltaproteobacteria bacterium]
MGGGQTGSGSSGLAPNIASLLCYICLPITSIIFLIIEKENQDVRFHAWQGTAFGVAYLAAVIALQIVAAVLGAIASVLGVIVGFFVPLVGLAAFILWIVCLVKAYQGERWRIRVIGDFATKKAGLE